MNTIISTSIFISLFIVGLRIISSPGMIFYFLREKYDKLSEQLNTVRNRLKSTIADISAHKTELSLIYTINKNPDNVIETTSRIHNIIEYIDSLEKIVPVLKEQEKKLNLKVNLLKPVIGCGTCMASFWTLIFTLPPIILSQEDMLIKSLDVVFVMFITATFNSIILQLYDLMKAKTNCNCK